MEEISAACITHRGVMSEAWSTRDQILLLEAVEQLGSSNWVCPCVACLLY